MDKIKDLRAINEMKETRQVSKRSKYVISMTTKLTENSIAALSPLGSLFTEVMDQLLAFCALLYLRSARLVKACTPAAATQRPMSRAN